MAFDSPPRGTGRPSHRWRDGAPAREAVNPYGGAPPMGGRAMRAAPAPEVVVPRIYLEPDEQLDALRRRALWWGICRDAVAVVVGLFIIGKVILQPMMGPVLRAIGL